MFNEKELEIIKYGLNNGKSKAEVRRALLNFRVGIRPQEEEPQRQTFFAEAGEDVMQVFGGIKESALSKAEDMRETLAAQKAGEQGLGSTAWQMIGQGAGFVSDIIGNIFKGVVKVALPEKAEEAVRGRIEKIVTPVMESEVVQNILRKYNALDPETRRNLDAAIGISSLALDVTAVGATLKVGKVGAKIGIKGGQVALKKGAETIVKTGSILIGAKSYPISRIPKLLGIFSGESDDIIKAALRNPEAARIALEGGDDALRRVVKEGAEDSIKIRNYFIKTYSQAKDKLLGPYAQTLVPKKEVKTMFDDLLIENKVKILDNGKLDFTISKIVASPGEATKIRKAYQALEKWDNLTISSLDDYKQLVGKLRSFATEAGVPSKSPFLGTLYSQLNDIVRKKLPNNSTTQIYIVLNESFGSNIGLYDDMVKAFNSGDPFTKLANAFGENKDTLRQVIEFYERESGKSILSTVAGREIALEKQAAFGFLNPRSWIDFVLSPELQGKIILKVGKVIPKEAIKK